MDYLSPLALSGKQNRAPPAQCRSLGPSPPESILPPACLVRPDWVSFLQGLCTARHSFLLPGVKAKKPIQTKFRMPLLNWVALKPSQITGTVFTELNDEKVLQVSGYQGCTGHGVAIYLASFDL